jgi:hypothetical protein
MRLDPDAVRDDPQVWENVEKVAASISREANRTSAKIGITYNRLGDAVRIGPRGAAAIVVEFGGRSHPARRHVKRALDAHRIS